MAENYVLLETINLTQSAASVTFDNIPQSGYTDLKVVMSARSTYSAVVEGVVVRFNGDNTSGNYSYRRVYGNGASAVSDTSSAPVFMDGATATANTFTSNELYLPNYTSSVAKSMSVDQAHENNATTAYVALTAALWTGTAAINSITFTSENAASFVSGSTFSLYGLAAVGTTPTVAPKATGGNIVANDGTYWYHAFLSSGTFTPQTDLTCDVLQIAGGGAGGGYFYGAGGGAGGLLALTSQLLILSTSYTVTVGAGGSYSGDVGSNGSNSQFSSLTAAVGGGRSANQYTTPGNGGSGGGANTSYNTPGTGTSGQGNSGGSVSGVGAGGGGGAGAAGGSGAAGAGGNGLSTYSSWGSATSTGENVSGTYWYAGGGGSQGSNHGLGGGGGGDRTGATNLIKYNGIANTGGGGGGAGDNNGYNGGSGIVIIRYAMA